MKKQIITGISVIACAALWPRSAEDGKLPAEPEKQAVTANVAAKPEKGPQIVLSADNISPELKAVVENKDIISAEKAELTPAADPKPITTPTQPSSVPKSGGIAIINSKLYTWIPGFGWIEDHGSGSVGIPIDELTANKVDIIGSGTFAADMYENGHKIGSMGGEDVPARESIPEPTGDEIHIVLIKVTDKNSTLPPDKPDTAPPTDLAP